MVLFVAKGKGVWDHFRMIYSENSLKVVELQVANAELLSSSSKLAHSLGSRPQNQDSIIKHCPSGFASNNPTGMLCIKDWFSPLRLFQGRVSSALTITNLRSAARVWVEMRLQPSGLLWKVHSYRRVKYKEVVTYQLTLKYTQKKEVQEII